MRVSITHSCVEEILRDLPRLEGTAQAESINLDIKLQELTTAVQLQLSAGCLPGINGLPVKFHTFLGSNRTGSAGCF